MNQFNRVLLPSLFFDTQRGQRWVGQLNKGFLAFCINAVRLLPYLLRTKNVSFIEWPNFLRGEQCPFSDRSECKYFFQFCALVILCSAAAKEVTIKITQQYFFSIKLARLLLITIKFLAMDDGQLNQYIAVEMIF